MEFERNVSCVCVCATRRVFVGELPVVRSARDVEERSQDHSREASPRFGRVWWTDCRFARYGWLALLALVLASRGRSRHGPTAKTRQDHTRLSHGSPSKVFIKGIFFLYLLPAFLPSFLHSYFCSTFEKHKTPRKWIREFSLARSLFSTPCASGDCLDWRRLLHLANKNKDKITDSSTTRV